MSACRNFYICAGRAEHPDTNPQFCDECWEARPTLAPIPDFPVDVLPTEAQKLVNSATAAGLPASLVAGASIAALATAIGGAASLRHSHGWEERAIIWCVLIAPPGAGKSPSQDRAFEPLRRIDREAGEDGRRILVSDTTLEALARELAGLEGSAGMDCDELAVLLRGLGEYKGGGGADRGRFLQLWSGGPWRLYRVGQSKTAKNKIRINIDEPTLPICGTLQTRLHGLLGDEEDGLRPRFLPFLAELPETEGSGSVKAGEWDTLLTRLAGRRDRERTWMLSPEARATFRSHQARWKKAARGTEALDVSAALIKADKHCLRIALVLAEADHPTGDGGWLGAGVIERSAAIVDFVIDSWRALPVLESLALSRRDEQLDKGVQRLIDWLERRPERTATRREIRRARVGGARTEVEINALLERYEAIFPGSLTKEKNPHGSPSIVVRAPRRGVIAIGGTSGATNRSAAENACKSEGTDQKNRGASWNGAASFGASSRDATETVEPADETGDEKLSIEELQSRIAELGVNMDPELTARAADRTGASVRGVYQAQIVQTVAPDLADAVMAGTMELDEAFQMATQKFDRLALEPNERTAAELTDEELLEIFPGATLEHVIEAS